MATAGRKCAEPVISTDFFPTILEATGIPAPPDQHKDGVSFLEYLKAPGADLSGRAMVWHYPHWGNQGGAPGSAMRVGKWKVIRWDWVPRVELFNLEDDPGEEKDLSLSKPEIVKEMLGKLDSYLEEVGAYRAVGNPNFEGVFQKW